MSSCLSGSSRTCGFDLDIVKPLSSSSASARSFQSSSPSSTLSETSNSHRTISIKKARTPRKRPNQTYNEAAALLSTIYPNVFSAITTLKRLPRSTALSGDSFQDEVPELLPPFPVLGDAEFFIQGPPPPEEQRRLKQPLAFRLDLKPLSPSERSWTSSSSSLESPSYNSSPVLLDDDFDAESILDEEVDESIDSIMGNLSMNADGGDNDEESGGYQTQINPYLRSLIGLRTGGKYDFGLRLRHNKSMQQALRRRDEGEWWRTPAVPVGDIAPQLKSSAPPIEKKKKKKVEKNGTPQDVQPKATTIKGCTTTGAATTTTTTDSNKSKATALGLKLNHEAVLNAWSGASMFTDGPGSPDSSADALAKLSDIDLFGDGSGAGGVMREASVQRYKEKRRSRLFSKKIRYQVRKVNADSRPRMQGRFVRRPSLLQQAIEHEISQL